MILTFISIFCTGIIFSQSKYDIFKYGSVSDIKEIVSSEPLILNSIDSLGRTPLWIAIDYNPNEDVAIELIKYGSDINTKDTIYKLAPIYRAILKNRFKVFNLILTNPKINLNIQSKYGLTPIFYALSQRQVGFANRLLDQNVDVNIPTFSPINSTPIFAAISSQLDTSLIKRLIDLGTDLTHKTYNHNPLEYSLLIDSVNTNIISVLISTYKIKNIPFGNSYELLRNSILKVDDAKILNSLLFNNKPFIDSLNSKQIDRLLLLAYNQKDNVYFRTLISYGFKPDFRDWTFRNDKEKMEIDELIKNASR